MRVIDYSEYKANEVYEFSFSLYTHCNLRCKFCFQNHKYDVDPYNISDLIEKSRLDITNILQDRAIKLILVRMYGGELFSDDIPDEIFDEYHVFIRNLEEFIYRVRNDIKLVFYWGTNAVFTKRDRVKRLLESHIGFIAPSYDSVGRFISKQQKNIWWETAEYFIHQKKLTSISIMLVKPCIEAYIHGDEYFEKIPGNIWIDVNQYIPNSNYQEYLPSDDDIYNFYKWCIDTNHFNVEILFNIINNMVEDISFEHCFCKHSKFFSSTQITKNCIYKYSNLSQDNFYHDDSSYNVSESNCNDINREIGLQKRGCFTCEHFKYCPKMCWTSIIGTMVQLSNQCPYDRIYKYIEQNNNVLDNFIKFRQKII